MSGVATLPAGAGALEVFAGKPGLQDDVGHLQTWLSKQRHLPSVTDKQLVTFLHCCGNRVEAAKKCIDAYFTCKTNSPEFFSGRDPLAADVRQVASILQVTTLSTRSAEGHLYVVTRLVNCDPSVYQPDAAVKLGFMVLDAALRHDPLVPGIVVVQDMRGVQFQHMAKVDLSALKKQMCYVEEAMPIKLKSVHAIHVGPVIHSIMSIMRPFMSKEHLKLVHFHAGDDGMRGLDEFVPRAALPRDYGGDDASMDELFARTMTQLRSYRDWFLEEEAHCKVDEALRQGDLKAGSDVFGKQGSFKKLDFD